MRIDVVGGFPGDDPETECYLPWEIGPTRLKPDTKPWPAAGMLRVCDADPTFSLSD